MEQALLLAVVVCLLALILGSSIRILREDERAVIFRLGRLARSVFNPGGDGTGPGLLILIPLIDKMVRVSLRPVALDIPPQDILTQDNAWVRVGVRVHFRPKDPERAITAAADYPQEVARIAQETLRSVLRWPFLEDLVTYRDRTAQRLQERIGEETARLGVEVTKVEIASLDTVKR